MAIGDGGGLLGLSVDLNLRMTGFEALTGITERLEQLQVMALKTEQAFERMGMAFTRAMNTGGLEATRAMRDVERVSRTGLGSSAQTSPIMGTNEERIAANYENRDFELRQRAQASAVRESERAIRDETEARRHAWDGLKSGILGTLGISAGIGLLEVAKSFVESAGKMDDRRASLRLQGYTPAEVAQSENMALNASVPGLDLSEKVQLAQQIGTTVGRENVTPEAMRGIGVVARANARMAGGSLESNIETTTQATQSLGNLVDASGKLSAAQLTRNAVAVEHMIAVGGGRITGQEANQFLRMTRTGVQPFDVAGNVGFQADLSLLMESQISGKNANQALRFLQGGNVTPKEMAALHQFGMTTMQRVPMLDPMTGKSVIQSTEMLALPKSGDPLDFYRKLDDNIAAWLKATGRPVTDAEIAKWRNTALPTDVSRVAGTIASRTGREEQQKNIESIGHMPQSIEGIASASVSLPQALEDVEKAFSEFAQVASGPLTHDLANGLEMVAHGMHGLSVVLGQLGPVLPVLTRIVEMLAMLAALRLGGRLLGGGAGLGGRLLGLGAGAGGGGVAGAAEGLAVGALAGRAMSGAGGAAAKTGLMSQVLDPEYAVGGALVAAKMGAMKMAGRGLTAMVVGGIADSVVDTFTTEGSDTNSLIKDAIEGSAIGATVAGWPGAIIGAILDPLTKHLIIPSVQNFDEMNKQVMKDNPTQPYLPMGVEPMMPVPGFTNADALGLPQQEEDARERNRSKFMQSMALPIAPTAGGVTTHPAPVYTQSRVGHQGVEGNAPYVPLPNGFSHTPSTTTQKPSDLRALQEGMNHQTPPLGGSMPPPMPSFTSPAGSMQGSQQAPLQGLVTAPAGVRDASLPPSTPSFASPATMPSVAGAATATMPQMTSLNVSTINAGSLIVGSTTGGGTGATGPAGARGGAATPTQGGKPFSAITGGIGLPALTGGVTPSAGATRIPQGSGPSSRMPIGIHGGAPTTPLNLAGSSFAQKSPQIMARLQHDLGLTKAQASGIMGNLGHESAGLSEFQERGKAAGSGGAGWAQWTGPRRREFEQWSKSQGLDPKSDTANLGFLEYELKHGESKSLAALKQTNTVGDATSSFMRNYERPGVAALGSRDAYANAAFNSPNMASMPNLQGPQISPEQADIPASSFHMVNHMHVNLDSEEMSEHVMKHVIGGGPTAASGSTGYDQKMHPMIPGTSPPQW